MTEITRSIEIVASRGRVWSHIHPGNWTKIFHFVKDVDGYKEGDGWIGKKAKVVAGDQEDSAVKYNVEITEFVDKEKITYRRYGGPLSGTGVMYLKPLQTGTLLRRTSYYDDDLSEQTIKTLCDGMERDNLRLKAIIEKIGASANNER